MSPTKKNQNEDDEKMAKQLVEAYEKIREQVHQVIVGQDKVLEQLLIAMLARGHCLLEGVPGLAKTLMIRSLSQAIDLSFIIIGIFFHDSALFTLVVKESSSLM